MDGRSKPVDLITFCTHNQALLDHVAHMCHYYEKTAPTVSDYLDGLYQRLERKPDDVRLSEILMAQRLLENGLYMAPALAANTVYKLMNRLGMDTTGHAGY